MNLRPVGVFTQRQADRTHGYRAQREIKHRARFGLTGFAQRRDLHIGHRRADAREQADHTGEQLVFLNSGVQRHHHASKAHQHRGHERALFFLPAVQQRAAQDKGGNPDPAHVIQRHGGCHRKMCDGVEPSAQRCRADDAAGEVHQRHRRAPGRTTGAQHHRHKRQADQAPEKDQLKAAETGRCKFDTHRHAGKQECRQHHP